jgi:hypothetical protein
MGARERSERVAGSRALLAWYGVLGAPLAWTVELLAGYGTQEAACSAGSRSPGFAGNANSAIGAITVATLLIALGALLAALVTARAVGAGEVDDPRGRIAFMSRVGTIGSLLFSLAIVLSGIPLFTLVSCHT